MVERAFFYGQATTQIFKIDGIDETVTASITYILFVFDQ